MVNKMSTTISISEDTRNKIREFGTKGDTYDDILKKLYESAKQRQLQDLLMNEEGCIPIEDALARAQKRWLK